MCRLKPRLIRPRKAGLDWTGGKSAGPTLRVAPGYFDGWIKTKEPPTMKTIAIWVLFWAPCPTDMCV